MLFYKGIDEKGEIRTGEIDVDNTLKAFEILKSQGIKPIEITKKTEKTSFFKIFERKPSQEVISFLLYQLYLMLSSGMSLTQSLETLRLQTKDKKVVQAILSIKEDIERGESIQTAFRKTGIFPDFLIEMLKVAERGENLEKIFKISAEFLDKVSDLKNRIFTSLTYPMFVILFSFLSVIVVVNFVMPRIAQVLTGLGKSLPLLTKVMLSFAHFCGYLIYLIPVLIVLFALRSKVFKKEALGEFYLKIPLLGKVYYNFNLSRFAYVLSMCLSSGIPIVKAVSLSVRSITNFYIRKKLEGIENEVAKGKSIVSVFAERNVFPELFVNLLNTGQKSGELEKVLHLISTVYDKQAMRLINFWLRLVEPVSILIIGVVVALIVLSVIIPLTEISSGVSLIKK